MKNTLESPNLSPKSSMHSFALSIPKNVQSILITLRNSFSHGKGMARRTEIIENARDGKGVSIDLIQEDLKQINNKTTCSQE